MKLIELLSSEDKLSRKNYAETEKGMFTNPRLNNQTKCEAVKWDIVGGLMYCYPVQQVFDEKFEMLKKYLRENFDEKYKTWVEFNDRADFYIIKEVIIKLNL